MHSFKVELKHTCEILHEEQERVVKIEAIKKSLEVEVKVNTNQHSNNSITLQIIFCRIFQFVLKKSKPMPLLDQNVSSANWKLVCAITKWN